METNRLLASLTDPDEETRAAALEELADEMNDEIAQALLDIAESDAAEDVRDDAIIALGPVIEECGMDYHDEADFDFDPELGPPVSRETFASIVRRIRGLYDDEAQPKVIRRRAFEVLVRDPLPWLSQEIRDRFASADSDWRLTAVFAMGYVTGFETTIAETVSTAKGLLLLEAVRAAANMEVSAAASRIHELATSRAADLILRLAAIEALPHVDPGCIDVLEDLTRSEDREIAEAAEYAVEELIMFANIEDDDFELEDEDE
jgi:HEAT repeat protein